jgi:alkaline phosphatase
MRPANLVVGLVCSIVVCSCATQKSSALADQPAPHARNVILFVGDGMGIATVTAARILDGQQRGGSGEDNVLSFERFPNTAFSKTYSFDMQVAESAGTMTAMMSGQKTHGSVIGEGPAVAPGECKGADAAAVPSLLEQAEDRGLATGVVTTTRITHATPAGTYAHSPNRNWEADTTTPQDAQALGCRDIARQLIEFKHGNGVDVILGGGRALLLPRETADPERPDQKGVRADGRNLIETWLAGHAERRFVWNAAQFDQLAVVPDQQILGLFEPDHMQFSADRDKDAGGEPSLAEMTAKAIKILDQSPKGYFLMVEGGRIDHGHHAGNAYRALTDAIAFADAVAVADQLTDAKETLIIVTADHSHTLFLAGYAARGNPILDKARNADGTLQLDGAGMPYTTLGYANGPGALEKSDTQPEGLKHFPHAAKQFDRGAVARVDLTNVDTMAPDYMQEAEVPMSAEAHGGEDVPVYARGPGADAVHGVIEQNQIYTIMRNGYGW